MRGPIALFGIAVLGVVVAAACGDTPGGTSSTGLGVGGTGVGPGATTGPGTQGTGAGGSSATGAPCPNECASGLTCCDGACVNTGNDIHNCGACGKNCPGPHAYCASDGCAQAPCDTETSPCDTGQFCCGANCCAFEELCCGSGGDLACVAGPICPP